MFNWGAALEILTLGPLFLLWLWIILGFGVARTLYKRRYKRLHGRYPEREDVSRLVWVLLSLSPVRNGQTSDKS